MKLSTLMHSRNSTKMSSLDVFICDYEELLEEQDEAIEIMLEKQYPPLVGEEM